eukprot:CAMPEP_0198241680 /NCGR_PEP_ID=MMETSP1446-20131203/6441_1 /TAXON_ID=1461542 ORGANISM="Unidentified sp, Strain CCMP2111" /NCGR_SAMPLE_ID=MMETSP1446 /ASSEMBLY_ACC=CAM_ASM_001112 /LENGTH=47 /DNA_ID= /DNA_START= /DNA_END= /DNA_ORIENTATION=
MLYDPNSYFYKSFLSMGGASQKAKSKLLGEKKDDEAKKDAADSDEKK